MSVDRPLELARAIAVRNFDEQQRVHRRFADLTGGQYQPINPLIREGLLLASTRIHEKILSEPEPLYTDPQQLISTAYEGIGDDVFDEMVREIQKDEPDPLSITGPQLRSLSMAISSSVLIAIAPATVMTEGFNRLLRDVKAARELSLERDIEPSVVYSDEVLYRELIRRTYTPREFFRGALNSTREFTTEKLVDAVGTLVPDITQSMDEIEGVEPLMTPDELQKMRQEMLEDPEFIQEMRALTLRFKKAFRVIAGEQVIRFWGDEGLQSLPKVLRGSLANPS